MPPTSALRSLRLAASGLQAYCALLVGELSASTSLLVGDAAAPRDAVLLAAGRDAALLEPLPGVADAAGRAPPLATLPAGAATQVVAVAPLAAGRADAARPPLAAEEVAGRGAALRPVSILLTAADVTAALAAGLAADADGAVVGRRAAQPEVVTEARRSTLLRTKPAAGARGPLIATLQLEAGAAGWERQCLEHDGQKQLR